MKRSTRGVLQSFYQHFLPSYLIRSVVEKVNADLQDLYSSNAEAKAKAQKVYDQLTALLGEGADLSTIFELDDDTGKTKLTEAGAAQLLIKAGYLKETAAGQ